MPKYRKKLELKKKKMKREYFLKAKKYNTKYQMKANFHMVFLLSVDSRKITIFVIDGDEICG